MECDYCDNTENLTEIKDSIICPNCMKVHEANERQKTAFEVLKTIPRDGTINVNDVLRTSHSIDANIQVRTDLFNAATVAITDLKKSIDDDESIENKPYALASELTNRLNDWKKKIFELNESIVSAQNQQRAIQQYLNNLANQLRVEEREKLKLQNINYNPSKVKIITPKKIKAAAIDKKLLRDTAAKLLFKYPQMQGVEHMLQMLIVSKGCTVQFAADMMIKSIESAKSDSTNSK